MKDLPELSADDYARDAVLKILRDLFRIFQLNVDQVLDDSDIEGLHDLRVAGRRTRTVLSQIKGVLPKSATRGFAADFKWLGSITGPCRDLDVLLGELGQRRHQAGFEKSDFDSLVRHFEIKRRSEHHTVSNALRSERIQNLIDGWGEFLESGHESGKEQPLALKPITEVAGPGIFKAHRRMMKRGKTISDPPSSDELHRLRLDAKKLRYLLEFFSSLYPEIDGGRLIRELKKIQDILGAFNDTVVQQRLLTEIAGQQVVGGRSRPETERVISHIADDTANRQEELRGAFSNSFSSFAETDCRIGGPRL